jgi:hypothetical protein
MLVQEIVCKFAQLDIENIRLHFESGQQSKGNDEFIDHDPVLVCDEVKIDVFNTFLETKSEGLIIRGRFLELLDRKLYIVDWPTYVHESVVQYLTMRFLQACGNSSVIRQSGSITAHNLGYPNKEADATFGPMKRTPNRTNPPHGIQFSSWITFAIEIAVSQSWTSLERAASWWMRYPGIQYILCIKVSHKARCWSYRLYSISTNSQNLLPQPIVHGEFRGNIVAGEHLINLDARRVLSIPHGSPLPQGVNSVFTIDLKAVVDDTRDSVE